MDKDHRFQFITQQNPLWAVTIYTFFEEYPEFQPYAYLVPLSPHESCPYPGIDTLFHAILHYICAAGVRYDYAARQWSIILKLLSSDWDLIVANLNFNNSSLQNKKKQIYIDVCAFMNENGLTHETLDMSHLPAMKAQVKGIGDGCLAWCKKYFTTDDNCVEYTDIAFKKGFQTLYGTSNVSQRKKKAEEWVEKGFGRIGGLMVLQISGTRRSPITPCSPSGR
jgi:hypothetical protein